MHTVARILKQKGPHTNSITANSSVLEAAEKMKETKRSYLIVRSGGKYVGIISEKDFVYKLIVQEKNARSTLVKEIMTTGLPVVGLADNAEQCMILINSSKSRYLPAFDGDKFKGIVTIHDLMNEALAEHEIKGHHVFVD